MMLKRYTGIGVAVLLIGLHACFLLAEFFAPNDYAAQNRDLPFAPPSRLHFIDAQGTFHARPFVYSWKQSDADGTYVEDQTKAYGLQLLTTGPRYSLMGGWDMRLHLFGVEPPGQLFLFGTDDFGRDQFSRMLYGGRISILAGLLGAGIALAAGGTIGIISGYLGEWPDAVLMRMVELFLALPWLYLLFAVRAILPLHVTTLNAFLVLVGVIGLVGWASPARLVRGITLSAKERNFVLAAKAMGASHFHILRRHVLPQTYGTILTMAALLVPQFILAEVTLSFLGLGVGEPIPSWGNLLAELQNYRVLTSYWWMYLPGIALVILFLAYHWAATNIQKRLGVAGV